MINHRTNEAGMSLVEVLVAALLLSIIILGLHRFYSALLADSYHRKNQLQAESIAFQLLDIYPQTHPAILPNGWQSRQNSYYFNAQCRLIEVEIVLPNGEIIQQQRLICSG